MSLLPVLAGLGCAALMSNPRKRTRRNPSLKAYRLTFIVPAKGKEPAREASKLVDARNAQDARDDANSLARRGGMIVKSVTLAYSINPVSAERLPKALRKFAHLIESYEDERKSEYGNGIWVYLIPGYWNPDLETAFVHEDNLRNVVSAMRGVEKKG